MIIPHLYADEEYCVKMKSLSFMGDSHFTVPLKQRIFRTGNINEICCMLLLLFPILFFWSVLVQIIRI